VLGLVLASLVLLIIGRGNTSFVATLRATLTDATAPALELFSGPIDSLRSLGALAGSHSYLSREVARLRRENDELRSWQSRALELASTVTRYEELLRASDEPALDFVTARVIADTRGPFVRTVIVNAGAQQGVRRDQAVMDGRGLVGRIIASGAEASRVLLVSDLNSRIPVRVEPQGFRAILTGTNQAEPRLDFLPAHAELENGNLVYTSGDGGQLPPGLAIGQVAIDANGTALVVPYADPARLRFVRIFEYEPALSVEALAEPVNEAQAVSVSDMAARAAAVAASVQAVVQE
jgi:rod shape-determining protein MreC